MANTQRCRILHALRQTLNRLQGPWMQHDECLHLPDVPFDVGPDLGRPCAPQRMLQGKVGLGSLDQVDCWLCIAVQHLKVATQG